MPTPSRVRISRARRIAFVAWIGVSTATIGIGFFGLTSLVIACSGRTRVWRTRSPTSATVRSSASSSPVGCSCSFVVPRKIAGLQQTALAALALLSVPLAEDDQNLVPGLIVFLVVGVLIGVALSSVDCPTCP
jgi:hypothetical protein